MKNNMEYCLMLSSIPIDFDELDSKYQSTKNAIESSDLWKKGKEALPDFEKKSSKYQWYVSLTKSLASGYKGYISFQNRHSAGNSAMHDDRLVLEFNPKKIDFKYIRENFFILVLTSFSSYRASIYDETLASKDFTTVGVIDTRNKIDRIHLIDFIHNDFCEIYFKKNAKKVTDLLRQNGFKVNSLKNGIIIVLADHIPTADDLEERSDFALKLLQK
ncbi:hypothetical protein EHQ58_05235 [Leptospira ognonensis]|uniref:Uncharacterized protein n=1 Tax=Leptospira ognonensis TaxID=2484945 RepID=A0A4R9K7V5_9LEPT|nr:hypothetical protein [Leptospira ognonensis]TGL61526.1 hypothetical protein EHQ58_05235 [Leptospira ognonensis]